VIPKHLNEAISGITNSCTPSRQSAGMTSRLVCSRVSAAGPFSVLSGLRGVFLGGDGSVLAVWGTELMFPLADLLLPRSGCRDLRHPRVFAGDSRPTTALSSNKTQHLGATEAWWAEVGLTVGCDVRST
jgi:hypothetical protein